MKAKRITGMCGAMTGALLVGGLIVSNNAFANVTYRASSNVQFTFNSVLSLVLSGDGFVISDLLPGQSATSNAVTATVSTNNLTGYTLSATVGNSTYNSTSLISDANTIAMMGSGTSLTEGTWGYTLDNGTTYGALDRTNSTVLKRTATNTSGDATQIKIGAYAASNQAGGTYNNVMNFAAVVNPLIASMQDYDGSSLTPGQSTTFIDSRDGQEYTAYRWPNTGTAGTDYPTGMAGYTIMTKDLSLGYVTGSSITRGADLVLTTADSAAAATITARTGTGDWDATNDASNRQYINGPQSGQEVYSSHSYYSFGAAQVVCPKGWRLPTRAEIENIVTFVGGVNTTGTNTIMSAPYSFVYGGGFGGGNGVWADVGGRGFYWTSTDDGDSSSTGQSLAITPTYPNRSPNAKNIGFSVRCIHE